MQIKFLGATQTVTGSKHLIKGISHNILVDCGLFQGPNSKKFNGEIQNLLRYEKIDAIILTHAHLDHCGYLPKLYKDGFRGPIFSTAASYDIAKIIMSDNARIQRDEIKSANKNIKKAKKKLTPMYTQNEVNQVLSLFEIKDYENKFCWNEYWITFKKAGHILGASSPIIQIREKRIQFSGDLGRDDDLIMYPPSNSEIVDYLVLESTYGDRVHCEQNLTEQLKKIFSLAKKNNAAIIIPAFSVGRSQTIMKLIYDFFQNNKELRLPLFVDSPMTHEVTKLYYKYPHEHKLHHSLLKKIEKEFNFIKYKSEKENLDNMTTAHVILTAGGMLSGGNVLHHLATKGADPKNKILIVGYQSEGTLGYELLKGNFTHSIEKKTITIEADIIAINGLSSHADHDALIKWAKAAHPKEIFIIHGKEAAKLKLKDDIESMLNCAVFIPQTQTSFDI